MQNFPDDYGNINDPPTEFEDSGSIPPKEENNLKEDEEKPLSNSFSYCSTGKVESFKFKGSSKNVFNNIFNPITDLNDDVIVFLGIILTWIGFGTVFEIDNGSERIVSPYLSSGTVR